MCVVVDRPQRVRSCADLAHCVQKACRQTSPSRSAMSAPVPQRGSRFAQLAHDLREALLGAFTVRRDDAKCPVCTQEGTSVCVTLAVCAPTLKRMLLVRVAAVSSLAATPCCALLRAQLRIPTADH